MWKDLMVMVVANKQIYKNLLRWDLLVCLLMGVVLHLFPEIDLWASQQFYQLGYFDSFQQPFIYIVYQIFADIHLWYVVVFIVVLALTYFFKGQPAKLWRKRASFLLLTLLLLPGVVVNFVLKDNSFGRPRPVQVEQYGGERQFSALFVYSGQCSKNCSFVSGHAATAFFTIAFAWAFGNRWIFILGMLIGGIVSTVRMAQGAHFLSDVIFSFWVVYFGTLILAQYYQFSFEGKSHSNRAEKEQQVSPDCV
jgi:lipid A 4'-phosphatase